MTVQAVERLKGLLSRVERNANVPRLTTQGLGAFMHASPGKPAVADKPMAGGRPLAVEKSPIAEKPTASKPVQVKPEPVAKPIADEKVPLAAKPAGAKPAAAEKPIAAEKLSLQATPPTFEQTGAFAKPAETAQPLAKDRPGLAEKSAAVARAVPVEQPRKSERPAAASKPAAAEKAVTPEVETAVAESPEPPVVTVTESEDLPLEDVSLDEISAVELDSIDESAFEDLDAEEIPVEVTSVVEAESPTAPAPTPLPTVAAASRAPFTAPPSLDDLRFSEPPPEVSPEKSTDRSESEPPPASAPHAVSDAPESLDAALRAATEATAGSDEASEFEAPLLTPPPESGPQVAVPPMPAPAKPTGIAAAGPTPEQLGEVIELEQSAGPPLELDEPRKPEPTHVDLDAGPEELEFVPKPSIPSLPTDASDARAPMQTLVGGFTEDAEAGPSAAANTSMSARLSVRTAKEKPARAGSDVARSVQVPPSATVPTTAQTGLAREDSPAKAGGLTPERIARGIGQAGPVVDVVAVAQAFRPRSFLELLDASVGLLKK